MLFVAEMTINHLGSNNIAKAMINEAKKSGANFVKFKFKDVDKYYPDDGKKWRNFSFKDYRSSLELDRNSFQEIVDYCKSLNIGCFATVHDESSLNFISKFNPCMYKIASMDADNFDLLKMVMNKCKEESKPLVYSIGGKSHEFFLDALKTMNDAKIDVFILHTVSVYPTPTGHSNIDYIKELINESKEYSNIKIGYSGHEVGFSASLMAATNKIEMIERHFTLSRDLNIHHLECALLPEEFEQMVRIISEMSKESGKCSSFSKDEFKFLDRLDYD